MDTGREHRGGQRQVALLAAGLAARGLRVRLAAPRDAPLTREVAAGGIETVAFAARSDLDLAGAARFAALARAFRPDVVHAHDARAHAMARWAQAWGSPWALVVTRRVPSVPRGGLKYRRGVARYIAISRAVRGALLRGGIPTEAIDLVPSAVRPPGPGEAAAAVAGPPRRPLLLTVSALSPEKGVDTVVRAAAAARASGVDATWIVLGAGPARGRLEDLARRLGAPVTFAGFVHDVGPALRDAALLVHTPRAEGLGTAVLEALARGVPIVATAVGGLPEIVDPRVGTLVPPDDPGAVVRAVEHWLGCPAARAAVREHGPRIAATFNVDAMVERTLASYQRVVGRRNDRTTVNSNPGSR